MVPARLKPISMYWPVRQGEHVLRARLDPAHRALQFARQRQRDDVLGSDPRLATEPTADVRGDDPQPALAQPEQAAGEHPEQVRHLCRDVGGDVVSLAAMSRTMIAGHDDDGVAFHRHHGDPLVLEAAADHDVGIAQRVDVIAVAQPRRQVRADRFELQRCIRRQCRLGIDNGRQRVVVDEDGIGGVDSVSLGVGDDDGDGITDEADLSVSQRWAGCRVVQS
jgi:hypothetical protein